MSANTPPSTEAARTRLTVAGDTQQQEQRITPPSHLHLGNLTVTFMSVDDGSLAATPSAVSAEVERKFRSLAEEWYMETMALSSYVERILHPAYQKILVLGKPAVPLIMEELRDMPNDWFWALRVITGKDPVNPTDAGRLDRMAASWLVWWEREGPQWLAESI